MKVSSFNKMGILVIILLATMTNIAQGQGTRVGFYRTTCPRVESIVQSAVRQAVRSNPTMAPGLLRIFFHDCFVNGCDASLLLNGSSSEKTARPNLPLRGFQVIDAAKAQLERACPGVVSCADIVALAARDSVVLTGGTSWQVPLGRRDGFVSRASDTTNLPAFNDPITVQIRKFSDKGLNTQDLVALVGGHTIGTAACSVFSYRLYNFNNTNRPDPSINQAFLPQLRALCPNGGVLESDAKLLSNPTTQRFVQRFSGVRGTPNLRFNVEFGRSMVKMGNIELKTGRQGEIRRVCTTTN
ncbi:heme peroxidase [Artemisia annua]|uniref:Peroxidase n=1 Tax=Artemisia annua TaxID=35608 RepID=A0A2U1LVD4_ARTAN|nr:heme peroxidase [Artemisia annua]